MAMFCSRSGIGASAPWRRLRGDGATSDAFAARLISAAVQEEREGIARRGEMHAHQGDNASSEVQSLVDDRR